jgi:hypothetical protein
MFKKWIFSLAAILTALSAVSLVAAPAFAKTNAGTEVGEKETSGTAVVAFRPITLYSGNGGVFFPTPHSNVTITLAPADMSMAMKPHGVLEWGGSFDFTAEKSQIMTQASKDIELSSFMDNGTVFFDLPRGWEQKALKNQDVAIYYMGQGGWKKLPTTAVHSSATMPRVGAAFAGEGTYALGILEPQQP